MRQRGRGLIPLWILLVLLVAVIGAEAGALLWARTAPPQDAAEEPASQAETEQETPEQESPEQARPETGDVSEPGETPEPETPETPEEPEIPAEPTAAQRAREILDGMTLEEKVGQMFLARCPETGAQAAASDYHLGGYLLFARDFEGRTPDSVRETIAGYQSAAEVPLLIGVDEEGGTVTRVSRYPAFRSERFGSPQEVYQAGGFDAVASDTAEKCELLADLGINVNFAPVCDISQDADDFIYDRSFGQGAEETAEYVRTVVEAMRDTGVACVLKHFPGYGDNADTHTGIAYDDRPYETFQTSDFLPFQAGIDSGAELVLVAHNVVSCMDGDQPASLSPEVHRILREELGFPGVIVTDDLAMDGVRDFAPDDEVAVRAVQAGNDLLCCTDFETQIPAVLAAVEDGTLDEARIDESVLRILELKISLGLL